MCSGPTADFQADTDTMTKEFAKGTIDADRIANGQPVVGSVAQEVVLVPVGDRIVCRGHGQASRPVKMVSE
jgi:hypothetical protein